MMYTNNSKISIRQKSLRVTKQEYIVYSSVEYDHVRAYGFMQEYFGDVFLKVEGVNPNDNVVVSIQDRM